MDFFFVVDLDLQQKKKEKRNTHTKKIAKTKKNPGECVQRGRGEEEEKTFTEWDRLT